MKRIKDLINLLEEILTLIIGAFVFVLTAIAGFFYTTFKHIFIKRDYSLSRQLSPIIRSITLCLDGFANASGGEMINDALKVKGDVRYGKWYHTISAITGLRAFNGNDNKFRRFLDNVLGENHCKDGITKEQAIYNNVTKMTLVTNNQHEKPYDALLEALLKGAPTLVELKTENRQVISVEFVQELSNSSFRGVMTETIKGVGKIGSIVSFEPQHIYGTFVPKRK